MYGAKLRVLVIGNMTFFKKLAAATFSSGKFGVSYRAYKGRFITKPCIAIDTILWTTKPQ